MTVQNRGEKTTYYLAWEHEDLSHPSFRYRDEPEQKDYDWMQLGLNVLGSLAVVGGMAVLAATGVGAAVEAGLIPAGAAGAGGAAAAAAKATFLTGALYVGEQAVSDIISGRVSDTEKYVRKALAGSAVGFLSGVTGLMMQGAALGKTLALGYSEGFLGSVITQGLLNEDGEINWATAIGEGMFSAVMAGVAWGSTNKIPEKNNEILRYEEYWKSKELLSQSTCSEEALYEYLYHINPDYAINYTKTGKWPSDIQIPKSTSVLNKDWGIDWSQVPRGGFVLDINGNPIKESYIPLTGDIIDRYGSPNGTYTSPVIEGKVFDYAERSLPYIEDASQYHQYEIIGDFTKIKDHIQNCKDPVLKGKIDAAIIRYYSGNYDNVTAYIGDIAPGFGTKKGGIQVQLPFTIEQLEGLGMIRELQ